jgi:hypothetical protein
MQAIKLHDDWLKPSGNKIKNVIINEKEGSNAREGRGKSTGHMDGQVGRKSVGVSMVTEEKLFSLSLGAQTTTQ